MTEENNDEAEFDISSLLTEEEEENILGRIELIRERLENYITILYNKIKANEVTVEEENEVADRGIIANLILQKSLQDEEGKNGFNKLLYVLFREANGSLDKLLSFFSVELYDEGEQATGFNIAINDNINELLNKT